MWWSLISTWLRLSRTVPVHSITGQYILCLTDKFAAFFSWNCVITKAYVTSKIASYSRDMQCLLWTTSVWSLQTALIYKTRWTAAQSSILLQDESVSTDLKIKMFTLEGWHAFVFKHSGFKNFHLLWTFNVELLSNISGSFIVVVIFRIIFLVLFQIFLSVLPLVTFVP